MAGYNSWFTASQVGEKVWRIDDNGLANIYLIEGEKQAMLIDTGTGSSDLEPFVRGMTGLPVIVINTHAHSDHSGSNPSFGSVYAHAYDFDAIYEINKNSGRVKLIPVNDGFLFDLGGRTIEVIESPGHTRGSICLLDRENKILFAGDTCNLLVWLFLKECMPLEVYLASLQKINKRIKEFDTIMPGHGTPLDSAFLEEMAGCTKNILEKRCSGEPYHSHSGDAMLCSYKRASVAFDPGKLAGA